MLSLLACLMASALGVANTTSPAQKLSECTTTPDLGPTLGPRYNQLDSNLCHTLTATEQLTKKMQDLKVIEAKDAVHPLQVAAAYAWHHGNSSPNHAYMNLGTPIKNFEAAREYQNICTVKDLGGPALFTNPLFLKANDTNAIEFLSAALKVPNAGPSRLTGNCTHQDSAIALKTQVPAIQSYLYGAEILKRCPTLCPPLKWNLRHDFSWGREVRSDPIPRNEEKMAILDQGIAEAMSKGSLPAIEYRANFIKRDGQFRGQHWSSITQRIRGDDGKCYYKLRLSWGLSRRVIAPNIKFSRGDIIVDREELLHYATSVQWLD